LDAISLAVLSLQSDPTRSEWDDGDDDDGHWLTIWETKVKLTFLPPFLLMSWGYEKGGLGLVLSCQLKVVLEKVQLGKGK